MEGHHCGWAESRGRTTNTTMLGARGGRRSHLVDDRAGPRQRLAQRYPCRYRVEGSTDGVRGTSSKGNRRLWPRRDLTLT
jgi:hypothetical protein